MSFVPQDFAIIGLLIFLEGILSIDNALVLAILAKPLPKHLQKKALTYGLIGALVFRFIAILATSYLIKMRWLKFVGGGYLLWIAIHELFLKGSEESRKNTAPRSFWKTVLIIELTDIAFAVDSILAAVALTPKFWLVFTGGVIGMILMRFSATFFITLLEKFPGLSKTAYVLVLIIGVKVIVEALEIEGMNFHSPSNPAFWVFWLLMLFTVVYGFLPRKKQANRELGNE